MLYNYKPLNTAQIYRAIENSDMCSLGVAENNQPYVIPMCFRFEQDGINRYFTMKSYTDGMKMTCIENNQKVCLEFVNKNIYYIDTVVVFGTAQIITPTTGTVQTANGLSESIIKVTPVEMTGRRYEVYRA